MCAFYCIFDDYYRPIRNGDDDDEIVSRDMVTMNWGADWSRETKIVVTMKNELKKKKKKNGKKKKMKFDEMKTEYNVFDCWTVKWTCINIV